MISIIIPCYNAEKLVGKCIESVLRQTYGLPSVRQTMRKDWKRSLLKRMMMRFY